MHAVLMLFAELVSHAASTLQMAFVRRTRECHTTAAPEVLPRATSGLHQEADQAAPTGLSTGSGLQPAFPAQAGIQTPLTVRTRKLSPLIPTNVGIQGELPTLSHLAASSLHTRANRSRIPTAHPEPVEGRRIEWFRLRDIRLT